MAARRLRISLGILVALLVGVTNACSVNPGRAREIVRASDAAPERIRTAEGVVRGVASSQGKVFLGIPFAAPPVGRLRFAPPALVAPWTDIRDASQAGPACPQSLGAGGAEDCLTLNVYAPHDARPGDRLPVMVWIYGGALALGQNTQYDPTVIAERQKLIVVAPNYRVGVLGFFAHPALHGKGEGGYGLLDQQAALAWVNRNIEAFGGDPGRVTLFGQSAGALSVCAHLAIPGSYRYFQGAIIQSGTCAAPDTSVSMEEAEASGVAFAAGLGCRNPATALACLRALPARRLMGEKSGRRGNIGRNGWAPMTGGDLLPEPPAVVFASGDGARVPVIMGSTRDEGRLFSNILTLGQTMSTRGGFEKAVAGALPDPVVQAALEEYRALSNRSYDAAFSAIVTDSHFACPVLTLHRLLGARAPFYAYEFDDPNAPSSVPRIPFAEPLGSYHASEIAYLFQRPWALANPRRFDRSQWALSDRIQTHWAAFARSRDPNIASLPPWPVFDGRVPQVLSPSRTGPALDFAARHRCDFWARFEY